MTQSWDVAIVGAGPYGLSLAAHLRELGISFRIFGKPLDTWRNHMPKDMLLKSDGFASSLSSPAAAATLKNYCGAQGIPYADTGRPVSLDVFNAYASWFQKRYVPEVETGLVTSLERTHAGFALRTEDGARCEARNVVLATGITSFAHKPETLAALPDWAVSHSYDHRDVSQFEGRSVIVVGGGASAIDTAALLKDSGADVRVLVRERNVRFHRRPDPEDALLVRQLQRPTTGIGPGWRSFFCANTPLLFHRMPEGLRLRATRNHLGPAPGWFMRERILDRVPLLLEHRVECAQADSKGVVLGVVNGDGEARAIHCDHVIAATGYRPNLDRLSFLDAKLRAEIAAVEKTAILSTNFETSVRGLYVTGPAAANSFGPLMRFMVGAEFAAPRIAAHLKRRAGSRVERRAA